MTLKRRLRLFIRRSGGYLLDVALLALVLLGAQALILKLGLNPLGADPQPGPLHRWVFATVTLPALLYFALMSSARGATLGQRVLHLGVVDAAGGERLPFARALIRAAVLLGPWELIHTAIFHGWGWAYLAAYAALGVLVFSIVLQQEGRGLHDLASGGRVISGGA